MCAEWDYGGIPTWLAYKPGIRFRSYNDQWRAVVQRWVGQVVEQTRSYFADHGGPIVLAQIENELGGSDPLYVQVSSTRKSRAEQPLTPLLCSLLTSVLLLSLLCDARSGTATWPTP